ncbi:hypothetical protein EUGRSUZ_C00050 [Eucalyptus grandis]|uniref:Uncharacterized protein n=2 Tax=Eucalyptus grandis TaxID=71139 RepID=A0A059CK89_EUCGR|nr:hypothetical protein EUGRSUZ_C00050 [Eucalyptus grandis]
MARSYPSLLNLRAKVFMIIPALSQKMLLCLLVFRLQNQNFRCASETQPPNIKKQNTKKKKNQVLFIT